MLKALSRMAIAVAAIAVISGPVQAGEFDSAVSARKAVMQLRVFYLGQLGAMAKGKMAYDAKKAQSAADSLVTLTKLDGSAMWPPGSGSDKLGVQTRAKAEIWSTYPAIADKNKALVAALGNMAKVAGGGLAALQGSIGNAGKACGGCHKAFRGKKM